MFTGCTSTRAARRQAIRRGHRRQCDRERHPDTPDLYELIFKRLPDDVVYTENDKQTYKSILLTTNAHRRGHGNALTHDLIRESPRRTNSRRAPERCCRRTRAWPSRSAN
ncbi:hypothetical protein P5V15_001420 [Pogonomyrmex californicus]